jgi:hypothetical protein
MVHEKKPARQILPPRIMVTGRQHLKAAGQLRKEIYRLLFMFLRSVKEKKDNQAGSGIAR